MVRYFKLTLFLQLYDNYEVYFTSIFFRSQLKQISKISLRSWIAQGLTGSQFLEGVA